MKSKFGKAYKWLHSRLEGELYGIAIVDLKPEYFLTSKVLSTSNWITISKAKGYIADPFFLPGESNKILCEVYNHFSGLGSLEELTVEHNNITHRKAFDIGISSHLSYPFTWEQNGTVYCLPEMAESQHQILYKLIKGQAPEIVCTIAENVGLTDPTLMRFNEKYWIAYTDQKVGIHDNLCLLYAEQLEGPWRFHPKNPVKIDISSCRPAGTPFRVGNKLYRPAQDCKRHYGSALAINKVNVCTLTQYEEEVVAVIQPDPKGPFPDGIHTVSFSGNQCVIDGKKISHHPLIMANKAKQVIGRNIKKIWT